jgi:chromosomal replication initiation ATPase DnaA
MIGKISYTGEGKAMDEADKPNAMIEQLSARRAQSGSALARLARLNASAAAVVQLVAAAHQIEPDAILKRGRRAEIAASRQLAMYLTHVMLGVSLTEVGALFGRDRTTVGYACAQIEDHRENAAFDAEVSRLETAIDTGEPLPVTELRHAG